jgi:hypothetical protein
MTEPGIYLTVVIDALVAEYKRGLGRLQGAETRLTYALSQVEVETPLRERYQLELQQLAITIKSFGGTVPPSDEPSA